jgi:hypothetical protein
VNSCDMNSRQMPVNGKGVSALSLYSRYQTELMRSAEGSGTALQMHPIRRGFDQDLPISQLATCHTLAEPH